MVKFQFVGPNTDQAVVYVARNPMKSKENSLRLSGKAADETSLTVSGISEEWRIMAVTLTKDGETLYNAEAS